MAKPAKKVDPAIQFTCANCKRVRPNTERHATRLVCADTESCRVAMVDWLSKESFAVGVTKP